MIFKRQKKNTYKETIKEYSAAVIYASGVSAENLRKEYEFSGETHMAVLIQFIGFSLIMLARKCASVQLAPERYQKITETVIDLLVDVVYENIDNRQRAIKVIKESVYKFVEVYGKLPVKNDDPSKREAGTLLWEYGKLIAKTATDEEKNIWAIMTCISLMKNQITATNSLIERMLSAMK